MTNKEKNLRFEIYSIETMIISSEKVLQQAQNEIKYYKEKLAGLDKELEKHKALNEKKKSSSN